MSADEPKATEDATPTMDADEKEIEQKMIKTILGMPKEVQDRFKVLHMLSDKRSKLNDEFNEACKKLEQQILEKKRPFLDQRQKIIAGEQTEFGDLVPRFDEAHKELEKKVAAIVKPAEEPEAAEEEKTPTDVSYLKGKQGIPDFWVRAMKANRLIWDQVKEKDEEIMEHLLHVETNSHDNAAKNTVVSLKMVFAEENDFFKPATLEVALEYESEDQVKEIKGTKIEWLEGKDPTKKKIKKKQKHKKTGETRTVVKTVDADSFFNIFQDRTAPKDEEGADSEEENDLRDKMDEVQQTVEDFHDLLVPDALEYYLGLNEDFDMLGMDPEGDESGDDDDDGDEDDALPKEKKAKKGGAASGGASGAASGDQKECKQQ